MWKPGSESKCCSWYNLDSEWYEISLFFWECTLYDSCCEKINLFRVQIRGSLIPKLQCVSCQQLLNQTFSGCPTNFCFIWHRTCMHTSTIQLTGNILNVAKSPYFSTPQRVIFSQHTSYVQQRDVHVNLFKSNALMERQIRWGIRWTILVKTAKILKSRTLFLTCLACITILI